MYKRSNTISEDASTWPYPKKILHHAMQGDIPFFCVFIQ